MPRNVGKRVCSLCFKCMEQALLVHGHLSYDRSVPTLAACCLLGCFVSLLCYASSCFTLPFFTFSLLYVCMYVCVCYIATTAAILTSKPVIYSLDTELRIFRIFSSVIGHHGHRAQLLDCLALMRI